MPRYYNLTIVKPNAAVGDKPFRQWTTNPQNGYDPGALNVEFDILVAKCTIPYGADTITIYGIALNDLLQATQFAGDGKGDQGSGMILTLSGGMTAGLPLVNPKQAGILVQGVIVQSFGNWLGTDMTLDLVIRPSAYTPSLPGNIVLNWKAGTTLSTALQQTFNVAYPGVKQNINISSQLVLQHDEIARYPTLEALASGIDEMTSGQIVSDDYPGVSISYQGGQLYVADGTQTNPTIVEIAFTDLIGQPTWIDQSVMQFTCVMRSDITFFTKVKMPQGLSSSPGVVNTTASSLPNQLDYKTSFQGTFTVQQIRHVGNLRAPDAQSWVTVINAATDLVAK